MADKNHTERGESKEQGEARSSERRTFLRRAALVGLPAVLATVQPRTAWATNQMTATAASVTASGPTTTQRRRKRKNW